MPRKPSRPDPEARGAPRLVPSGGSTGDDVRPDEHDENGPDHLDHLLGAVSRGDTGAFESVYDRVAGSVYGVIRRVLRDPAQSEEVAQEVMVEVWRTATRFDRSRGSASTWIHTMAHRRAIDRVRSTQSAQAAR